MVKGHLHWSPKKAIQRNIRCNLSISNCCWPFWKICSYTKGIWKEYNLLCDKRYMPLKTTKRLWLKQLTLNLCAIVVFFNYKIFINEVLVALVDQMTKDKYVLFVISSCILTTTFNYGCLKEHMIFLFLF
jgi:hypothetical protein